VSVHLSVRHTLVLVLAKREITQIMPHDSPLLFPDAKNLHEIPMGLPPTWMLNRGGIGSNGAISQKRCKIGT